MCGGAGRLSCSQTLRRHFESPSLSVLNSVWSATDFDAELDRSRCGSGPISRRSATDLEPEVDRSRGGVRPIETRTTSSRAKATCRTSEPPANSSPAAARPISSRSTTDLDASFDRSRRGSGPISARNSTDLGAELDRSRGGAHEPARDRPVRLRWGRFAACGPCPERPRLNSCSRPLRTGA